MCDCYEKINQQLAQRNTRIVPSYTFLNNDYDHPQVRATILTEKIDTRKSGKPLMIYGSYCPFCGEEQK